MKYYWKRKKILFYVLKWKYSSGVFDFGFDFAGININIYYINLIFWF